MVKWRKSGNRASKIQDFESGPLYRFDSLSCYRYSVFGESHRIPGQRNAVKFITWQMEMQVS